MTFLYFRVKHFDLRDFLVSFYIVVYGRQGSLLNPDFGGEKLPDPANLKSQDADPMDRAKTIVLGIMSPNLSGVQTCIVIVLYEHSHTKFMYKNIYFWNRICPVPSIRIKEIPLYTSFF